MHTQKSCADCFAASITQDSTLQVMIDVMVAAGEERWGQQSGLVMLLPHGYDGQVRRLFFSKAPRLSHMPAMA